MQYITNITIILILPLHCLTAKTHVSQELSDKIATREVVKALGDEMRVRIDDLANGMTEINGLVKEQPEQASAQVPGNYLSIYLSCYLV